MYSLFNINYYLQLYHVLSYVIFNSLINIASHESKYICTNDLYFVNIWYLAISYYNNPAPAPKHAKYNNKGVFAILDNLE